MSSASSANENAVFSRALIGLSLAASACVAEPSAVETTSTTAAAVSVNTMTRESFDNLGRQENGNSSTAYISGSQRYVVFASEANVWAPGVDTNGHADVYLKDRQTGSITLVSAANGVVGDGESFNPSVGDNGTVVFESTATNLAAGATSSASKILARTPGGSIVQVDRALSGAPDGPASRPKVSGDGSFVIFESDATNLVANDTNETTDVFVASVSGANVTRVSLTQASTQANNRSFLGTISYDGQVVAFSSDATNILFNDGNQQTDVFARNLQTGFTTAVSFSTTGMGGAVGNGLSTAPQISGNGAFVSFLSASTNWDSSDTNGLFDVYVKGVGAGGAPSRVSVSSAGAQADGASTASAISFNGDAVAFVSTATTLVPGNTNGGAHVFVRSRSEAQTVRIDQSGATLANGSAGSSGLRFSGNPSAPGYSFLVFDSAASNLVWNDTNGFSDVFSASVSP
jgi:hypothetical protein